MKKYLLLLLSLWLGSAAFAQEFPILGMIMDAKTETPLTGANITLTSREDGATRGAVADEAGRFRLTARPGAYELKVTYLGYQPYTQEVVVENGPVRAGRIALEEEALNLQEAIVKEKLPTATMKGDTTQFNAGAYKVNPDASAENLIRKMPGVTVEGGQVQAQGENVQEVLVDGKPFFGNDPMAALRNLPAEVIDKIQVFDRSCAVSGIDPHVCFCGIKCAPERADCLCARKRIRLIAPELCNHTPDQWSDLGAWIHDGCALVAGDIATVLGTLPGDLSFSVKLGIRGATKLCCDAPDPIRGD